MSVSNLGLFIICAGIPMLFGSWAQWRVSRTFKKYSQIPTANGLTGADAASAVLRESGLPGLQIRPVAGRLSDHYDPRSKTLNLSADVGQAATVAALGVAAHEAGHAIQDARGYKPMRIRQAVVPVASIGSQLAIPIIFVALIDGRLLEADELDGAKRVLGAAAWTYVAAFVAALAQLLYFFAASRR